MAGTAELAAPTRWRVVGSSLGGFYATVVAERLGCRAVLLNPAVDPARDLARYIGEITAWHSDERFHFRAEFVDELRDARTVRADRPRALLRGHRQGRRGARLARDERALRRRHVKLLEGSDHALSDFELHLPDLLRFLGLA